MGVAVRVFSPRLRVVPGTEASVEVRIRNTGVLVDQVDLTVLGEPAVWATVDPPRLNLLPGQDGTARLTFAPPRSFDVAAGDRPYAIRAASREDPDGSSVEEAVLEVAEFELVVAELVPRASRAPRAGRHELAIDNLSNHPLVLALTATDPDEVLDFKLDATEFTAAPGTSTFVRLRARPITRFLRGTEKALPFEVAVRSGDTEQAVVPGTVRQHAIVPGWLFRAMLALTLVAALWVVLLKPKLDDKVKQVAQEEAIKATDPLTPKLNTLIESDDAAKAAAAAAGGKKPTAKPTTAPTPAPTPATGNAGPTPAPTPLPGQSTSFFKEGWVEEGVNEPLGPDVPVKAGYVMRVADIYVESPYGDTGTVVIDGIKQTEKRTRIQVDAKGRGVHIRPDATTAFDAKHPVKTSAHCTTAAKRNPGPSETTRAAVPRPRSTPGGPVDYCRFVVFFDAYTDLIPVTLPTPTISPEPSADPTATATTTPVVTDPPCSDCATVFDPVDPMNDGNTPGGPSGAAISGATRANAARRP